MNRSGDRPRTFLDLLLTESGKSPHQTRLFSLTVVLHQGLSCAHLLKGQEPFLPPMTTLSHPSKRQFNPATRAVAIAPRKIRSSALRWSFAGDAYGLTGVLDLQPGELVDVLQYLLVNAYHDLATLSRVKPSPGTF